MCIAEAEASSDINNLVRPTEDTILPLSNPIRGKDGKLMSEILVPKGTLTFIASGTSNINKAIWGEDAEEWKPERWLASLPESVSEAKVPGIYSNLYASSFGPSWHYL